MVGGLARVGQVTRVAAAVVALAVVALVLAWSAVGWPALVAGVPLLFGTVVLLGAVALSRAPRRRLQAHRAARRALPADGLDAPQGGLMSGFYELPTPPRR